MNASRATVVATVFLSLGAANAAQASLINIANWNVGNLPNAAADETRLGTIFSHIGTLAGGRPLDLLALIETDTASADTTTTIARSSFGVDTYASLLSGPDGGGDRTGFIYNTATLSPISTVELSAGLTHRVLRTHFQPVGGGAGSDFYVYSTHLRSGETSAIRADRFAEAQTLRADADVLGSANVIFVGDFNWQGAAERGAAGTSAYETFAAPGEGSVSDAVNAAGAWRDNPDYLSLHTNDPGAAMDDRFDMQLISDELHDGLGIDYVAGSYRVVGNNGTHTLNADIRTGTGAPADVLDALFNFSDHLPVLASYQIVPEPTTLFVGVVIGGVSMSRRRRAV